VRSGCWEDDGRWKKSRLVLSGAHLSPAESSLLRFVTSLVLRDKKPSKQSESGQQLGMENFSYEAVVADPRKSSSRPDLRLLVVPGPKGFIASIKTESAILHQRVYLDPDTARTAITAIARSLFPEADPITFFPLPTTN
jgi:hypothetical protein